MCRDINLIATQHDLHGRAEVAERLTDVGAEDLLNGAARARRIPDKRVVVFLEYGVYSVVGCAPSNVDGIGGAKGLVHQVEIAVAPEIDLAIGMFVKQHQRNAQDAE